MVIQIPKQLISHNRKVANLYKKWLRYLEGNIRCREEYRYQAVLARVDFDAILNEKDLRVAKIKLLNKEEDLYTKFVLEPIYFPDSPQGVAYNREYFWEDWLLDYWHPLEKAVYPQYFARREVRKQQYIEMWQKKYGPPPPVEDH